MMNSSLWGPPIWKMMLACSWSIRPEQVDEWRCVLFDELPLILPCGTCRENMVAHIPMATRFCNGIPKTSDQFIKWCWSLKHKVNQITKHPSIPLSELVDRYVLHGAHIDEVELADVLMLFAISSRKLNRDDVFISFCRRLSLVLPIQATSSLRRTLAVVDRPIVNAAHRCARNTRIQHGLRPLVIAHYRAVAS